jgi:hypothetical protein
MKYVQPYGISDPDASYINGNPATGTMGSIPPAASIEHPQREIVQVIKAAGRTPTDADLKQLLRSIRGGALDYYVPTGTGNSLILTMALAPASVPPLDAYYPGLALRLKVAHSNAAGPVTINIDALGDKAITLADGSDPFAEDMETGQIVAIVYDGVKFQLMGTKGGDIILTDNRDYYVNGTTGLDSNDGLTAGTAFRTIQKAADTVYILKDLAGYTVTIHVATGNYPETVDLRNWRGNGTVMLIGNETTPANCHINATNGYAISSGPPQRWWVCGFKFSVTAPDSGGRGYGVYVSGEMYLRNVEFGYCPHYHMYALGGQILIRPVTDTGTSLVKISGNCGGAHAHAYNGSIIYANTDLTITVAVSVGTFLYSTALSTCTIVFAHPPTNPLLVTGKRFDVRLNSVIDTGGGGDSYLPGSTPGTFITGGQYT